MEMPCIGVAESPPDTGWGAAGMLHFVLMRTVLSTVAAVFGGFGVFFLISSFDAPHLSVYAVMFLGTATAIQLTKG